MQGMVIDIEEAQLSQERFMPSLRCNRCRPLGRDGCTAQHLVGTSHQKADGARPAGVQRCAFRAAGGYLSFASAPPAWWSCVSGQTTALDQEAPDLCTYRPLPRAASQWHQATSPLCTKVCPRRGERGLSHQCGGQRHAVPARRHL
jgi:hypothetical protein